MEKPFRDLKCMLFMIAVFFSSGLYAQVSKSIELTTPGDLSELITDAERLTITNLTVAGPEETFHASVDHNLLADTAGSSAVITINATIPWHILTIDPWLVPDITAGSGNGTVSLVAQDNPFASERETIISLVSDDQIHIIAITFRQSGKPTGIEEHANQVIQLYPSPFNNVVNITGAFKGSLQIYNMQGKLLISREILSDSEIIDLSGQPAGIYILLLNGESYRLCKM
jgi:hypothetical protein